MSPPKSEDVMPSTTPAQSVVAQEIDEDAYLIECLMARVAGLVAMTPGPVPSQLGEARAGPAYGNASVAAIRDITRKLRKERQQREIAARAKGGGAEIVRLVFPSPDRVRGD